MVEIFERRVLTTPPPVRTIPNYQSASGVPHAPPLFGRAMLEPTPDGPRRIELPASFYRTQILPPLPVDQIKIDLPTPTPTPIAPATPTPTSPEPAPISAQDQAVKQLADSCLEKTFNEYIPDTLLDSPKHLALYLSPAKKILYGGVAGSGKSFALMARALKYVHIEGYYCLVLRKQQKASKRASGLYHRLSQHLQPWIRAGIVKHHSDTMSFTFPSGAVIEFSYLSTGFIDANQGLEYTTVIIDEITQVQKSSYDFWWSRLRRHKSQRHLPTQLIVAGNPGGIGNKWVVREFGITKGPVIEKGSNGAPDRHRWLGVNPDSLFLEADLSDNPVLDITHYEETLKNLNPTQLKQLKYGDWSAEEDSRYKAAYFIRRWTPIPSSYGTSYALQDLPLDEQTLFQDLNAPFDPNAPLDLSNLPKPKTLQQKVAETKVEALVIPTDVEHVFTTVDVACSTRTGVAGVSFYDLTGGREVEPSYSVASTWASAGPYLLLLEVVRLQDEAPKVLEMLRGVSYRFPSTKFYMETNGVGKPIMQQFQLLGFQVYPILSTADKITNSIQAQSLANERRVILPAQAPWLDDFLDELLSWYGHKDQTDDQIDTLSNAAVIYGALPLAINPRLLQSQYQNEGVLPIDHPDHPLRKSTSPQNPTLPLSQATRLDIRTLFPALTAPAVPYRPSSQGVPRDPCFPFASPHATPLPGPYTGF